MVLRRGNKYFGIQLRENDDSRNGGSARGWRVAVLGDLHYFGEFDKAKLEMNSLDLANDDNAWLGHFVDGGSGCIHRYRRSLSETHSVTSGAFGSKEENIF
ncbi:unnamed protein product [Ascophyllum nodosum]